MQRQIRPAPAQQVSLPQFPLAASIRTSAGQFVPLVHQSAATRHSPLWRHTSLGPAVVDGAVLVDGRQGRAACRARPSHSALTLIGALPIILEMRKPSKKRAPHADSMLVLLVCMSLFLRRSIVINIDKLSKDKDGQPGCSWRYVLRRQRELLLIGCRIWRIGCLSRFGKSHCPTAAPRAGVRSVERSRKMACSSHHTASSSLFLKNFDHVLREGQGRPLAARTVHHLAKSAARLIQSHSHGAPGCFQRVASQPQQSGIHELT